jgi:hypothetical protein
LKKSQLRKIIREAIRTLKLKEADIEGCSNRTCQVTVSSEETGWIKKYKIPCELKSLGSGTTGCTCQYSSVGCGSSSSYTEKQLGANFLAKLEPYKILSVELPHRNMKEGPELNCYKKKCKFRMESETGGFIERDIPCKFKDAPTAAEAMCVCNTAGMGPSGNIGFDVPCGSVYTLRPSISNIKN